MNLCKSRLTPSPLSPLLPFCPASPCSPCTQHEKHTPVSAANVAAHSHAVTQTHKVNLISIVPGKSCRACGPKHPKQTLFSILTCWSNWSLFTLKNTHTHTHIRLTHTAPLQSRSQVCESVHLHSSCPD